MTNLALADDLNPDVQLQMRLEEAADIVHSLDAAGALESTGTSLTITQEISYERYEALGVAIGLMNRSCQWWIGDWLLYGENAFSDRFAQAAVGTGLSEQVLLRRMHVARQIPSKRRRASLPFSVHVEVANLGAREQKAWLDKCERSNWTRADLRAAMRAARHEERPPLPLGEPDLGLLVTAARAIVQHRKDYGADWLVTNEDMARLEAALGEGE